MNWYVTKLVYQIICGKGNHAAQFDEQLRLITASSEDEAFAKALQIGHDEEEVFCNTKNQLVQWRFVNVAELFKVSTLIDGAEIYSRITESDDAEGYVHCVHQKAAAIKEKFSRQLFQLI